MMPRSGGLYVFARRAFGDGIAFFLGYTDWLTCAVSTSALLLLIGEYTGAVVPVLQVTRLRSALPRVLSSCHSNGAACCKVLIAFDDHHVTHGMDSVIMVVGRALVRRLYTHVD